MIKKILTARIVSYFLLPLLITLLVRIIFRAIDARIDGNGIIENNLMVNTIYFTDILACGIILYGLLCKVFQFTMPQFVFNVLFILALLYGIEYYNYKNDPFYQLPFDSDYYLAYRSIYAHTMPLQSDPKNPQITWGHQVRKNRFGFREKEFAIPKPDSVYRIMALGDSFTWGSGLAENQRYTNLLDSMLKQHISNIEVLNFGLTGLSTVKERDILLKYKDIVLPNLIIVGFCINDPQPKGQDYVYEKEQFINKYGTLINQVKNHLIFVRLQYLAIMFERYLFLILEKKGIVPDWTVGLNRTYHPESEEWKNFVIALHDIKRIADSLRCPPPVFAAFNSAGSLPDNAVIAHNPTAALQLKWLQQARTTADSLGFIILDFSAAFQRAIENGRLHHHNLKVSPLDEHPSAEMNKIYAEELFKIILPIVSKPYIKQ
jgi:lysophospholipase L1-like esterase